MLCAGFPCQSFSNIGNKEGLSDPRGALIFEVIRLLTESKPKSFLLENVKGLLTHDKGKTFAKIYNLLNLSILPLLSNLIHIVSISLQNILV